MDISPAALFDYLTDDLRDCGLNVDSLITSPHDDYFPGATPQEVYALRLVRSFYKKFIDVTAPDADARCLEKFLQVNHQCKNWRFEPELSVDEELFGNLKLEIDNFLHPQGECLIQSYFDLLGQAKTGPGASLGANGYDFYTKLFSSPLTLTSPVLYQMYNEYCAWSSNWTEAELVRAYRFGVSAYTSCSSLLFVPKSRDISRSICVEPSLNMFYQLGLATLLSDRLRSFFNIDLSNQPEENRRLACSGSLDGSISTIDLSSASDSMSLGLCEEVFPNWFLDILYILRTPKTKVGCEEVELNMISTMGNGFTFPLQTMFFSSVVRAVARTMGVSLIDRDFTDPETGKVYRRNWSVFGDDIICPSEMTGNVYRLLRLSGFTPNSEKSYSVGPFRESCGHDYFCGHNVRGVYIKSLRTPQDRYVAINLLNEWSARSGLTLPRCVGYLQDSVKVLAIPPWENVDAGIRSPFPPEGSFDRPTQRFLYRCYRPVQTYLSVGECDLRLPRRLRRKGKRSRIFNPSGLWVSFLGGYIENSKISLRQREIRYRVETLVAPNWYYTCPGSPFAGDSVFWRRWKDASQSNLGWDLG